MNREERKDAATPYVALRRARVRDAFLAAELTEAYPTVLVEEQMWMTNTFAEIVRGLPKEQAELFATQLLGSFHTELKNVYQRQPERPNSAGTQVDDQRRPVVMRAGEILDADFMSGDSD